MSKHTKGPWRVVVHESDIPGVKWDEIKAGETWVSSSHEGATADNEDLSYEQDNANAQRIVACVNALEGLTNEEIKTAFGDPEPANYDIGRMVQTASDKYEANAGCLEVIKTLLNEPDAKVKTKNLSEILSMAEEALTKAREASDE